MKLLPNHPALSEFRTIHPSKVKEVTASSRLLRAGNNKKLGNVITKGKWRGMPIYSLTLEERATCPQTCQRWASCYGNNMGFAHRFQHGKELERKLWNEVAELAHEYTEGFVVRLHVLGDFYSKAYVELWQDMLDTFPNLRVYGYTAHSPTSLIGKKIARMNGPNCWIRFSKDATDPNETMLATINKGAKDIECPEQTGHVSSCANCGICWGTTRNVYFKAH